MKCVAFVAIPLMLSACAIGQSNFSCKGYPAGVSCMSAVEVYEATNDKNSLGPATAEKGKSVQPAMQEPRTVQFGGYSPPPARPVPLRADPVIMRIWFRDWQDEYGNLNGSSYVFAEVEKRRWSVGEMPAAGSRSLFPVAAGSATASNATYMSQAPSQRSDTIQPPAATVSDGGNNNTGKPARRGPPPRPGQGIPPRSGSIVE